jgi:hypothetical protein
MSTDFPEFGVDFETGTITQPDSAGSDDRQIPDDGDDDQSLAPPVAPPPSGPPEGIPRYRFDEVNQALRTSQEREAKLIQILEHLSPKPTPPAPPGIDPADTKAVARERIRQQFLEVFPEWKQYLDIQDKIPALLSAGEAIPRLQKDTEVYWGNVADATLASATVALGKTLGQTIEPNSRLGRFVAQSFFETIAVDPRLTARYEARDPTLIGEFVQAFEKDVFGPMRAQAAAAKRLDTTRRLPVAGRTSSPPSSAVPKHDPAEDEDAVFKQAWDLVNNDRRSMTP